MTEAAGTSARCSPPHTPQGVVTRKVLPSGSAFSSLRPQSHTRATAAAWRANSVRSPYTRFPHSGQI